MEALEEAVSDYESSVTAQAAQYLHGRGIDRETAVRARLGVVVDPHPGHSRFAGWLAIPYLDKDGRPLTIRFRCLAQHNCRDFGHGKYATLTDDNPRMFNVGAIWRAGDDIHVTEGELDALVLEKIGLHAVAVPGVNLWQKHHRRMLAGFSRIWVWGDPDDAGATFNARVTKALRQAKAVRLQDGDVTDNYLAGGADRLYAYIGQEMTK
ncbi:toprim domain-containing protein [Kineococcus esterisolvens]|uniref:toprim domain-containing protein n=1 Tax=unclassified Kineococcus TaxID=2621656 RepID=UPI003D7CA1D8